MPHSHTYSLFGIHAYLSRFAWTTSRKSRRGLPEAPTAQLLATRRGKVLVPGHQVKGNGVVPKASKISMNFKHFLLEGEGSVSLQIMLSLAVLPPLDTNCFCHFWSNRRCSLPRTSTRFEAVKWHGRRRRLRFPKRARSAGVTRIYGQVCKIVGF